MFNRSPLSHIGVMVRPVLLVLLLLAGAPAATAATTQDPVRQGAVDQAKAEAATLLEQGKSMEAYRLYSRLLREAPEDAAVNLGLARSALRAGRLHQAIMAYERLLEDFPNEPVLLRELAHAYGVIGDKEKARRYLEGDATLGEAETNAFMQALGDRYDRLQIHGRLSVGVLYDSNANQGPASNVMNLGNFRVILQDVAEKESGGAFASAMLDLGYRLGQVSPWWLVGDASFYARGNENERLRSSDNTFMNWYRLSAGMRLLGPESLVDLRLKAELFDNQWYHSVYAAGPEGFFVHAPTSWFQLITRAGIDKRDYVRDRRRNGTYGYAGQYARFFFGDKQHEFMAGGRYLGGRAGRRDYSYDGWEASASFLFKLPYSFEFAPSISYTREYYKGPATALEWKKRQDERLRVGAGLIYRLTKDLSLEAFYQYTKNNSESNYHEFDRHLTTFGATWTF